MKINKIFQQCKIKSPKNRYIKVKLNQTRAPCLKSLVALFHLFYTINFATTLPKRNK